MRLLYISNISNWDDSGIPSHKSFYAKTFKLFMKSNKDEFETLILLPKTAKTYVLYANLKAFFKVLYFKPDVIYCPINLYLIALVVFVKSLRLLKSKIVRWKYTPCKRQKNCLTNSLLIRYYRAFDTVYFLSRQHFFDSVSSNVISDKQARFINFGVDIKWFDQYKKSVFENDFIVISTGVENRDFKTLCESLKGTDVKLHIITKKSYLGVNIYKVLSKYEDQPNIKIEYAEDIVARGKNVLEHIQKSVANSSCVAVCAKPTNYGVGYTQVVESLPHGKPILQTFNKDNPIDVENENIGFNIQPFDVAGWKNTILSLRSDAILRKKLGENARKLAIKSFDAERIANDIFQLL